MKLSLSKLFFASDSYDFAGLYNQQTFFIEGDKLLPISESQEIKEYNLMNFCDSRESVSYDLLIVPNHINIVSYDFSIDEDENESNLVFHFENIVEHKKAKELVDTFIAEHKDKKLANNISFNFSLEPSTKEEVISETQQNFGHITDITENCEVITVFDEDNNYKKENIENTSNENKSNIDLGDDTIPF